ncbi:MAG: LPS export ABC transporter permease LptG [Siculibacillus sp.]|nr:LPS export ABC transporter permease LptG [Siculibacillus sp.]
MIGPTLGFYFGRRILNAILAIFAVAFAIVFMFDFLDMIRATVDRPSFRWGIAFQASFFRVPAFSEQVLPFATLFGAMAAFLALSRKLELVVARAAGISVWQFTAPAVLVAAGLGLFATLVFNPFAAAMKEHSDRMVLALAGTEKKTMMDTAQAVWLRQDGEDGESIVRAARAVDRGLHLADVDVFAFDKTGRFRERIEAKAADYEDGRWRLTSAQVYTSGRDPQAFDVYHLSTRLKREQVGESLAQPDTLSFWALPSFIETARNAGLPAYQFELQYQSLLARPLLLVAMVAIAATVSLRVFRFGNIGRMILGGVAAGFVLYVVGEVARGLGGAGMVPPALAAWSPAVVASSMGFTILLYLEDG